MYINKLQSKFAHTVVLSRVNNTRRISNSNIPALSALALISPSLCPSPGGTSLSLPYPCNLSPSLSLLTFSSARFTSFCLSFLCCLFFACSTSVLLASMITCCTSSCFSSSSISSPFYEEEHKVTIKWLTRERD